MRLRESWTVWLGIVSERVKPNKLPTKQPFLEDANNTKLTLTGFGYDISPTPPKTKKPSKNPQLIKNKQNIVRQFQNYVNDE